jgi:apolipoprotein N-acyltransferase
MVIPATHLRCAAAGAIGFALTTAHPLAIASTIFMPALVLAQPTRRTSYGAALSYYGTALWPIIPGAKNFFGPEVSVLAALTLWAVAAVILAAVWPLVWSADRRQAIWRSPVALLLTVLPPLGIIGFVSPLTAAGFLFPRTAWCGLLVCAVLSGVLAAWPRKAANGIVCLALAANTLHFNDPEPPSGWQGVNTNFGAIAHGRVHPVTEYQAAQWIQQYALSASAKVIVFPETVVPTWTAATEAFWQQTLDRLRASGKTILVGVRIPIGMYQRVQQGPYDFSADLAALRGGRSSPFPRRPFQNPNATFAYDNAVLVRGAETATAVQRIPVPIGMWNPFQAHGARSNLLARTVTPIASERAAVLVCYEQILTWPVLSSVLEKPTVFVAVANDHWATGTPIPTFQTAAVRAWSRLFGIPFLTATNQ